MSKASSVIDFARQRGAALAGIAPVERFAGAPQGRRPEDLLPGAQSVVAMAMRIPLAIIRRIPSPYYERFGYHDLNAHLRELAWRVALFLEDLGFEAVPMDPSVDERARTVEVLREEPEPRVRILGDFSHRHAFVEAGLGEIGAGSMAVAPKFGPRIRLVSVITTAALEPTPKLTGNDRYSVCRPEACGLRCVKQCPARALYGDGSVDHFKCRHYRNPVLYTLEYFQHLAGSRKAARPASAGARDGGLTCGLCIKACPVGIEL